MIKKTNLQIWKENTRLEAHHNKLEEIIKGLILEVQENKDKIKNLYLRIISFL
jgi:membrane carboxypeptidase/penicillin-binding protein PbpC